MQSNDGRPGPSAKGSPASCCSLDSTAGLLASPGDPPVERMLTAPWLASLALEPDATRAVHGAGRLLGRNGQLPIFRDALEAVPVLGEHDAPRWHAVRVCENRTEIEPVEYCLRPCNLPRGRSTASDSESRHDQHRNDGPRAHHSDATAPG
jgi:hypothetical protein